MDANEFWRRAFLASMGEAYRALLLGTNQSNHDWAAAYCERAADAALAVAQRRGMVTGERTAREITGQVGFEWEPDGDACVVRATDVHDSVRVRLGTEL